MGLYEFQIDDAKRFASDQGIQTFVRGNNMHFRKCPYCRNATDDKNTFAINIHTGQFKCLRASCGAHGNMITLAKDFDFSLGNDADEYYKPKKKYQDIRHYPRPEVRTPAVEFLEGRGISKAITEQYNITTQKEHDNILVFPFFDEHGQMTFVKYRKADFDKAKDKNKEWSQKDCKPILFGMDQCDPKRGPLILTEGQIDSLSVAESGIPNAVSVPTGAKGFTWVPYCWDFMSKFDELIVFGDHENGRITLLDEMQVRFHGTVKHVRPEDYLECKDANDILRKHGKQAIVDAIQNAVPISNPKIKKLSEVERKDVSQMECMDTGIKQLNQTLGGFYFGQLIILTGERGLGKSTLGSQFATYAVKQGYNTFCYSGELMDWYFQDWFDRQLAGPDHINGMVSNLGYTNYTVDGRYIDQIHNWYDEFCYIYDNSEFEDEDAERESLIDTIKNAILQYGCRVILVDNLMTAIDDDLSSDIYRQQTKFVQKLANMAKRFSVLILLVAHPRKGNGYAKQNDDVSGSANITNLADVIMWYEVPAPDEDDLDPSERILRITKNRLSGRRGSDIKLWFNESSKRISEAKGMFAWNVGWETGDFIPADDDLDDIPF